MTKNKHNSTEDNNLYIIFFFLNKNILGVVRMVISKSELCAHRQVDQLRLLTN